MVKTGYRIGENTSYTSDRALMHKICKERAKIKPYTKESLLNKQTVNRQILKGGVLRTKLLTS